MGNTADVSQTKYFKIFSLFIVFFLNKLCTIRTYFVHSELNKALQTLKKEIHRELEYAPPFMFSVVVLKAPKVFINKNFQDSPFVSFDAKLDSHLIKLLFIYLLHSCLPYFIQLL